MGRSSFQEAGEVIQVITFQGAYFRKSSKTGLLNSWEEAHFKRLVNKYKLIHFKGNVQKITPRGYTEFMWRSSLHEACEVMQATTFQGECFTNNFNRGSLNSWEQPPFKRLVKSYKLLHFKGNILKITPRGAYCIHGTKLLSRGLWSHTSYYVSRGIF